MNPNKVRRIIGVTALVLWAVAFVPKIIFWSRSYRLVCQLENWALIPASILSIIFFISLAIRVNKEEDRVLMKARNWLTGGMSVLICAAFFVFAIFKADYKVWSDKNYVIYGYKVSDKEHGGFRSPSIYQLYKRKGILDDRQGYIGILRQDQYNTPDMSRVQKLDFAIYESLDLIKEEMDYIPYGSDRVCHITSFYRLSDLYYYEQSQNDSLWEVINRKHYKKTPSSR